MRLRPLGGAPGYPPPSPPPAPSLSKSSSEYAASSPVPPSFPSPRAPERAVAPPPPPVRVRATPRLLLPALAPTGARAELPLAAAGVASIAEEPAAGRGGI